MVFLVFCNFLLVSDLFGNLSSFRAYVGFVITGTLTEMWRLGVTVYIFVKYHFTVIKCVDLKFVSFDGVLLYIVGYAFIFASSKYSDDVPKLH